MDIGWWLWEVELFWVRRGAFSRVFPFEKRWKRVNRVGFFLQNRRETRLETVRAVASSRGLGMKVGRERSRAATRAARGERSAPQ